MDERLGDAGKDMSYFIGFLRYRLFHSTAIVDALVWIGVGSFGDGSVLGLFSSLYCCVLF